MLENKGDADEWHTDASMWNVSGTSRKGEVVIRGAQFIDKELDDIRRDLQLIPNQRKTD
jgi:hypothetical protein